MLNKNRLVGAIAGAGFTQRKLAIKIGISKNTLNKKINGKGYFDTDEIDRICNALNIQSDVDKVEIFLNGTSQNRDEEAG